MKKLLLSLVIVSLCFMNFGGYVVAKSDNTLSQAVWSIKPNADYLSIKNDIYTVPKSKTTYIHMEEEVFFGSKVWAPDALVAINNETGKQRWKFSFAKPGYGWPSTDDAFIYTPEGYTYAYFPDERIIYAISPEGKELWSKKLPYETVSHDGSLYRLKDGTLLIAINKSSTVGSEATQFIAFNKDGKNLYNKTVTGKLVSVTDTQVILETETEAGIQSIHVYDDFLKKKFTTSFQVGDYVNFYTSFSLSDGTMVYPIVNIKTRKNKLVAVNPAGKKVWARNVTDFALAFPAGSNYLVFDYKLKVLGLYNDKGLIKKRVINNYSLLEGDVLPHAKVTEDGKLLIDLVSRVYIMDPATLNVIHDLTKLDGYVLDYARNSVIVMYGRGKEISKHHLK